LGLLLENLDRRLALYVSPLVMNDRPKLLFVPGNCSELSVILSFLNRVFHGNFHDQGILVVSESSQY
jgi:hypothetical protein